MNDTMPGHQDDQAQNFKSTIAADGQSDALNLTDVYRTYRQGKKTLDILKGATFSIARGEMVALVAPSGAGKSTLLHIAGLLESPDQGNVGICGRSTRGLVDAQRTALRRSEIGFVYQFHHLLPEFSALENLIIPQLIAGQKKKTAVERATQLINYMRIADRAEHRPSELSGGEQQRIAIARAVANAPSLLLADEPTGNLDPKTSSFVFDMLHNLVRESGLAALIATHNHDLARKMDRCVTLDHGQVVEMKL